ncbi:hypothetical protein Pcinc_010029 [Petrolisthes cinctipes]|uniref:Uncharacterized protein n=1 Tax=Petrolisthes cinctipes TaxID=88211 RepID=A0AAE1G3L3_PETCI|nr:hypothetical protein Pcinc_010029 [Petrolisthes cinctipes]
MGLTGQQWCQGSLTRGKGGKQLALARRWVAWQTGRFGSDHQNGHQTRSAEYQLAHRFPGGYDLLIGTSDKGENIKQTDLPEYSHAMIVFGGVDGLEVALEADEKLEATEPLQMFDIYANTCPLQQSRTIRTEEAIVITLAVIQDKLVHSGMK